MRCAILPHLRRPFVEHHRRTDYAVQFERHLDPKNLCRRIWNTPGFEPLRRFPGSVYQIKGKMHKLKKNMKIPGKHSAQQMRSFAEMMRIFVCIFGNPTKFAKMHFYAGECLTFDCECDMIDIIHDIGKLFAGLRSLSKAR